MSKRTFQVMIVPERSGRVRRYRVPYLWLWRGIVGGALLVGLLLFGVVNYVDVLTQAAKVKGLKNENGQLKERIAVLDSDIEDIGRRLERIDQFSSKVRAITRLNDPERNLAIGPLSAEPASADRGVMYAKGERTENPSEPEDSALALKLISSKVSEIGSVAIEQERSMRELHQRFSDHESLLASMPSVWPTDSHLLNSSFGKRRNPYTGLSEMHKGVDIACDRGADVRVTADGTVVSAGLRGIYGQTIVVDHGYGLQSHYAHLSSLTVKTGQEVKRGQVLGAAGDTGRTTGVHLHYEVRLGGIPQNPERYIIP